MSVFLFWFFEDSYYIVGDFVEIIVLLLLFFIFCWEELLLYWINFIKLFGDLEEEDKCNVVVEVWNELVLVEWFIFNKFIIGGFWMGVL